MYIRMLLTHLGFKVEFVGSHLIDKEGMILALTLPSLTPVISLNLAEPVPGPSRQQNIFIPISSSDNMKIESIITSIPNVDMNREYVRGMDEITSDETLTATNPYNLTPREKKPPPWGVVGVVGGIDMQSTQTGNRKMRGRKTNLSKA